MTAVMTERKRSNVLAAGELARVLEQAGYGVLSVERNTVTVKLWPNGKVETFVLSVERDEA